ncbi:MAG: endonuclease/exonuclease/phosphatase family protein [Bacteroidia bacterium]|nr:endonuclease/exonuclease/phosphatase family protein [Bacteroidia bacterium]
MKNKPSSTPAEETNWTSRLLNRTFFYLNIVMLPPALLVAIAPYIMPDTWWIPTLFSLHAPYWLLIPAFWTLVWLMFSLKKALFNFAFLIINYPAFTHTIQFNGAMDLTERDFKVMSYNIKVFDNRVSNIDTCIKVIKPQQPDILCVQEFWNPKLKSKATKSKEDTTNTEISYSDVKSRFKKELNLPYAVFFPSKVFGSFGLAIFSRFPIVKGKQLVYSEINTTNGLIFADIRLFGDTIRVYNAHLESYNFHEQHIDFWSENSNKPYSFRSFWTVVKVMLEAWRKQHSQIEAYEKDRQQCHYPVMVCGDLNATPYHPHYRAVRSDLQDAFEERGFGLGKTYGNSLINKHRIDYILASNKLIIADFKTPSIQYSDHLPAIATVRLKK